MHVFGRSQPIVKSVCYALLSLVSISFSASFFPAIGISLGTPFLFVAIVSSLAMKEGISYASIFAAILGGIEAFVYGESSLLLVCFYVLYTFLCIRLFASFFTRGFLPWALYTLAGILLHAAIRLFGPVSDWQVSAIKIIGDGVLQSIIWSAIFSLPIYVTVSFIKKKTD